MRSTEHGIRIVCELTLAQMKARYRRTIAGLLWVILNPILMYSAQAWVFKHVLHIGIPRYTLFLLGGLLPWIFIVQSLDMGIPVIKSSRELLMSFKIPPFYLVMSQILDNWVNFVLAFLVVLVPALILESGAWIGMTMLPFAVAVLLLGAASLIWFLAVLNIFYRDTRYFVQFLVGVLYFLTPIFYPPEYIEERFRWLVNLNPVYALIQPVRACIYDFRWDTFLPIFARGTAYALALLAVSLLYWRKRRNEIYFHV